MSWTEIARKDFRDALRYRVLWALTALFVLLVGGLSYAFVTVDSLGGQVSGSLGFVVFLAGSSGLFVSITAILIGYKAIAGERESGTLKFVLGLPHTRRDVLLGKVVGRSAVLWVALLAGFAVAAVVQLALGASFEFAEFVTFTLVTMLFGAAFVTIAVSISSVTASSSRAAAAAVGLWILNQVWSALALAALAIANGMSIPEEPYPDWYHALSGIGPGPAYNNAAAFFLPEEIAGQLQGTLGGLPEWYGLVVLALWLLVPLALGLYRFDRIDL